MRAKFHELCTDFVRKKDENAIIKRREKTQQAGFTTDSTSLRRTRYLLAVIYYRYLIYKVVSN